jgi:hypothetical protein
MHSSLSKRSNGSYYLFFFGDLRPVPVEPVADPIKKRAGQASIAEESAREWEFFSKEPALELQAERAWGSKGQGNCDGFDFTIGGIYIFARRTMAAPAIEPLVWTPLLLFRCRALFNDSLAEKPLALVDLSTGCSTKQPIHRRVFLHHRAIHRYIDP